LQKLKTVLHAGFVTGQINRGAFGTVRHFLKRGAQKDREKDFQARRVGKTLFGDESIGKSPLTVLRGGGFDRLHRRDPKTSCQSGEPRRRKRVYGGFLSSQNREGTETQWRKGASEQAGFCQVSKKEKKRLTKKDRALEKISKKGQHGEKTGTRKRASGPHTRKERDQRLKWCCPDSKAKQKGGGRWKRSHQPKCNHRQILM